MSKVPIIVSHLAIVAIGWGLVTALAPRHSDDLGNKPGKNHHPSRTKSERPRLDPASGRRLLARLSREVVLPEASDPEPRDSRSFGERVSQCVEQSSWQSVPQGDIYMTGFRQAKSLDEIHKDCRRAIISQDIAPIVRGANGPEFSYAFRHGRIDAQEILDHLAAQLPEQAADPLFPLVLYQLLAWKNPGLAEPLLASLSEKEKLEEKRQLFPQVDFSSDPDSTYALLSTIPWEEDSMPLTYRRWAWRSSAQSNLGDRRADYLAWLEALPRGSERDIAISGALLDPGTDADSAEYLRPLIGDPAIRELR